MTVCLATHSHISYAHSIPIALTILVFFLLVASAVLWVAGTVLPSVVRPIFRKDVGRRQIFKVLGIATLALFVLFFIVVLNTDTGPSKPATKSEQPVTSKVAESTPAINPSHQSQMLHGNRSRVKAFEEEFLSIEKPADQELDKVAGDFERLGTGEISVFEVYTTVRKAKQASEDAWLAYGRLDVPKDLPDDVEKLLDEAKESAKTAYFLKREAMDHALKFLDNQKPSDLDGFKEKIAQASQMTLKGGFALTQAKQKVGLPLEE